MNRFRLGVSLNHIQKVVYSNGLFGNKSWCEWGLTESFEPSILDCTNGAPLE